MRLHILQHVPFEGPGYIQEWAQNKGATITYTRFYEEHYVLPDIQSIDLLILLGGPMSVNDSAVLEWMVKEKMFIKEFLETGMPVLGICLGAQLIASTLGAKVHTATNKEIGWYPVTNTGSKEWLWTLFNSQPSVFHWHGEQFQIPNDASGYLRSEANINQGFVYGEKVIGLQFHLEATEDSVEQLLIHGADDIMDGDYIQTSEQIRNEIAVNVKKSNAILEKILNHLTMY